MPLSRGGELGPRLIQCGLGRGLLPYQVASSSIHPFYHNRHGPKTGGCVPFRGAATSSNNVAWADVYLRTKWHLYPSSRMTAIDMDQKLGWGCALFSRGREVGPSRTQSRLAEAYLRTKWHLSPSSSVATTDICRKLYGWGVLCRFRGGGAGSPSNTMSPRLRPTSVPSGILIQPFGHNRHGPKIGGSAPFLGGGAVPFFGGELGPHLTESGLG